MTSTIKVNTVKDTASTDIIKKCGTSITVGTASDTTTVAGNAVRSNALQASDGGNIVSQVGTTITLGASGDTIALSAGANQTGFGRTGTVDWQTGSIKTSTFTAVNGEGYFANTAGGAFEMDLPAGSAGAIVSVQDYNNTFDTHALTVDPNGSEKINGGDAGETIELNTEGRGVTFVYIDATVGWRSVQDNDFTKAGAAPALICASVSGSGNTLATVDTNFKVATFTGPGTFTVNSGGGPLGLAGYLVVAGGGASPDSHSGGAGGGGYREAKSDPVTGPYTGSPVASSGTIQFVPGAFPITVGAGGTHSAGNCGGSSGSNSVINHSGSTITSAGGGSGRNGSVNGVAGGSGGGGGATGNPCTTNGGAGNTPPVSPAQGFPGGGGGGGSSAAGDVTGGGGGATAAGQTGVSPSTDSGRGGVGATTNINGSPVAYAGGGGGGGRPSNGTSPGAASPCGTGGAANAGDNAAQPTRNGLANKGGGGGGGVNGGTCAGNGGSGIVVIRYKFQ